ncbi:MAG TPA: 2-oxoglutarate and iron-dependent oxygenase domain-containing protein [Stellaceae bacterium]|jgi:isopenicillin N synthase-like dioxygenase|nr:2-oxoglutarate and iron-dependent oxygenase domain-containing protein [Stellaceae bacterium]
MSSATTIHTIDIAPLFERGTMAARREVAKAIEAACRETGFFYITGHGIPDDAFSELERTSRLFFALAESEKAEIAMEKGGVAWRGWFPLGAELTSGKSDLKEGLYLGTELPADDPRVLAGTPFHGPNLWPRQVPELRHAVLRYMALTLRAADALIEGVALSLDLAPDYFAAHYTADPTILFRIFRYPPAGEADAAWGVGEHTDYGLLTLLAQDKHGGLQVRTDDGWIDAPPLPGTLICNIGDMLDRLTGGWYRSTPHRVLNTSGVDRLSFPLFFDPNLSAAIRPLPQHAVHDTSAIAADRRRRWDQASVHMFDGTYGDYLAAKVAKVFPELGKRVLKR